jgi:hypothetical protein
MPTNPPEPPKGKRLTIALAVLALIVVPLGAYVAGYFWLGERRYQVAGSWSSTTTVDSASAGRIVMIERRYTQQWLTRIYEPAGKVEGWFGDIEVLVWCDAHE